MKRLSRLRQLVMMAMLAALAGGCVEDEVLLADGRGTSFAHWEGRWLLINYWAEWCAPCRKEIPELNELHAERARTGVAVVGVNYDGVSGTDLTTLIDEMGIEFPVLAADPRLRWAQDPPPVLPTTLVIDPRGELHDVLVGPQTHESLLGSIPLDAAAH